MHEGNEFEGYMKLLRDLAKENFPHKEEPKLIHAIQDLFILKHLDFPVMSSEVTCPMCGGSNGYYPHIDPKISDKRMWFCAEADCLTKVKLSRYEATDHTANKKRSIEWPLFCEINGIGNIHHDVRFERIEQSSVKVDYLLKFAKNPSGIIFMQGTPGSGKTYASMAVCELFTRTNHSAMFSTQSKIMEKWIDEEKRKYINQLENCNLLVVDDFGTADIPSGFMRFFLDLINTRTQWTDRGTIITTNLSDKDFSDYCGVALNDRIKTGQKFEFKENSRRKTKVL